MMEQSTLKKSEKPNFSGTLGKKSVSLPNIPYVLQSAYLSYVHAEESEAACAFAKACYKKMHEGYVSGHRAQLSKEEEACFLLMMAGYRSLQPCKTWKPQFIKAVLSQFNA